MLLVYVTPVRQPGWWLLVAYIKINKGNLIHTHTYIYVCSSLVFALQNGVDEESQTTAIYGGQNFKIYTSIVLYLWSASGLKNIIHFFNSLISLYVLALSQEWMYNNTSNGGILT